jgi:hypothetical protein
MLSKSWKPLLAVAAVTGAAGILAGGLALRPAFARGGQVSVGPFVIVHCTSGSPCQQYSNAGTGVGLEGHATKGTGLEGVATTTGTGVVGASTSGIGVLGQSTGNYGIDGNSTNFIGVGGSSTNNIGVYAVSSGSDAAYADAEGDGNGVVGISSGGYALIGQSLSGQTAVLAQAGSGRALDAKSDNAGSTTLYSFNSAGGWGVDSTGQYIGIVARAPAGTGTFPLLATTTTSGDLFFVDGNGDVFYHGSLNTFTPIRGGREASAFGSKTTSPTIEDNGTAQLVNGVATVALDPTFAQSIDLHSAYHVMLTPDGDTRGLYVATKAPGLFVVREVQGGHGTLSFDYHIYAAPLGSASARMAVVDAANAGPRAPLTHFNAPKNLLRH